jgi:transcription antitermination factor NusA-like protein
MTDDHIERAAAIEMLGHMTARPPDTWPEHVARLAEFLAGDPVIARAIDDELKDVVDACAGASPGRHIAAIRAKLEGSRMRVVEVKAIARVKAAAVMAALAERPDDDDLRAVASRILTVVDAIERESDETIAIVDRARGEDEGWA